MGIAPLAALLRPVLAGRARTIAALIAPELRPGDSVLDIGAGDMLIGVNVKRLVDVTWIGVDTLPYPNTPLESRVYDGHTLPYSDGSFSFAVLAFVLHHCEDPLRVLDEASRVARHGIILLEDLPEGILGRQRAVIHDILVNKMTQPTMALPLGFHTMAEWKDIFAPRGLRPARVQPLKTQPFAFAKQVLFVLRPDARGVLMERPVKA